MADEETAPVYDERGNVRPRGTEGARPMSFEERVALVYPAAKTSQSKPTGKK